ncbi:MAG: glycosyltransferase family 2 protein [Clostridium sp.]|uniref:glycosyltransferase family 2 protein n=1 Tax=Clostridium sp. TaxID=1506 RepID=UPI003D6C9759
MDDYNTSISKILVSEDKPILSICIPTFNRAERLNKCLFSIFNQIGNNMEYEIIVSDNCSDDNTMEIVSYYTKKFNNILYFKNEFNMGTDKNFILSAKKANGKYIFLHGDDDYFKDGSLSMIMCSLKKILDSGIIFIDVRKKDNNVNIVYGLDNFIHSVSIYSTFASSLIMNGYEFNKIGLVEKMSQSNLSNLYWICSILEKNSKCTIINSDIYYQEEDNAPGGYTYSFAEVMIKNYFTMLEQFVGRGLNKETIENEKDNLVGRSLWYFEYGLKRKDEVFIKNFEEIFYEFYSDKEYFNEAWKALLAIKEEFNTVE